MLKLDLSLDLNLVRNSEFGFSLELELRPSSPIGDRWNALHILCGS